MNRFIRIIIFLIAIGCHFPDANAGHAKKDTISILSFNDFHGAFISGQGTPGAGNFVAALLELKKQVPNPVVLSGGDNFSGSYFSLMTQGEPHRVFTLPAAPDTLVSAVGNHEFDWGTDYLLNTPVKREVFAADFRELFGNAPKRTKKIINLYSL